MADRYLFADEAGNFDFSPGRGATRYFILTTVAMEDCTAGERLLALRRDLGWQGLHLDTVFHATDDPPAIRQVVLDLLAQSRLRIDSTIFEKRKAQPHLRDEHRFYKTVWFYHLQHVAPQIVSKRDRLFVVADQLGVKRKRGQFHAAVDDVVGQVASCRYRVAFWPAASDPCLQIADYCAWVVQRKWERGDAGPHSRVQHHVATEYDFWQHGTEFYY